MRLGIQHLLEEQGYVVRTAKDPVEALEELRAHSSELDLLLTDVVLPGLSGPELAVAAREIDPGLPTVFMSAFPQEELVAGTDHARDPGHREALPLRGREREGARGAGRGSTDAVIRPCAEE